MAYSDSSPLWNLRMPAGSLQQWQFTFTQALPGSNPPYPVSGATWEYVVRATQTDTGSPVFSITTTPSTAGSITVTSTASLSQVLLEILPAATAAALAPGTYYHGLWQNPGTTSAYTWFTGSLLIDGNPQP